MVPKTFHYTEQQIRALEEISKRTGIPVPELLRRAVDLLLEKMAPAKEGK